MGLEKESGVMLEPVYFVFETVYLQRKLLDHIEFYEEIIEISKIAFLYLFFFEVNFVGEV